jgi:hypothetical protein
LITTPTDATTRRHGRKRGQQQSFVRANPRICAGSVAAVHEAVALDVRAEVTLSVKRKSVLAVLCYALLTRT